MERSPFDMRSWELQELPEIKEVPPFIALFRDAHKFLIGNGAWQVCWEFGNALVEKRIFKLPFDQVLFEYVDPSVARRRITLIAFNSNIGDIVVFPFVRHDDQTWNGGTEFALTLDLNYPEQPKWSYNEVYHTTPDLALRERQLVLTDILISTVAMLSMKDTEITEVKVPNKIHKARRNKPPIYDYRFVELTTENQSREYQGGTHASPALHWRRGHFRKITYDRIVPVAPCLVGSEANGIIEKSYDGRGLTFPKLHNLVSKAHD